MTRKTPEIIEVNSQQMQELLDRAASNTLREEDTELMRQIFDSYVQLLRDRRRQEYHDRPATQAAVWRQQ